jgi:putative transposase
MNTTPNLEQGKYYQIYNRGRKGENLFKEPDNYRYFLDLYEKHIANVAETYAWVLMPNHFHLLVRMCNEETPKPLHQYFSNLFNAYVKAINKRFDRYGPLFVSPFERKEIQHEKYFKNVIHYIHNNPVHHKFVEQMIDYPWSSYLTILSAKETKLKREKVIGWFNSKEEFVEYHHKDASHYIAEDFYIEEE